MYADDVSPSGLEFPVAGLVPKNETGVNSLLAVHPEFDGRGVVIAVFDSALDPAAPGLQKTSDGRAKVIDLIDATGNGDVDTSHVEEAVAGGFLNGLSGRQLTIPVEWQCPSGKYHLGVKPLYELYPEKLRKRVQTEYKEKQWTHQHAAAAADCVAKQQEHEKTHPSPSGQNKLDKEDLDDRLEIMGVLDKQYKDPGPMLDCVVFHDGTSWRACVDTSFSGDLSQCLLMSDYRDSHQYAYLTRQCMVSYAVNVYQQGTLLSIVTPSSSHGTHVSAIAAAHFADQPEKNGMAPGAQLVSINIGDGRLGTMETGSAIARALAHLMVSRDRYQVDLINMSYGEHSRWSDSGRLGQLANELVHRFGVIWCASAGNAGPALSTVGAPPNLPGALPGTILGIGAYVTPSMMEACYGLRDPVPTTPYTWTSRDPSASSGGCYVSVCAPGCAITSVPNYTLQGCEQMNGTSMASPNVTGSLATLLSCLKGLQIPYTVYSVRRAIQATAVPLNSAQADVFAMGAGMLRVDKALEHLRQFHGACDRNVTYLPTVNPTEAHGIYLRDGYDLRRVVVEKSVAVKSMFLNRQDADPASQIEFEQRCALSCDASWVQVAKYVHHMNSTRNFAVKVDARALEEGVHHARIRAVDVSCPERGAVFEVPVTVIVPVECSAESGASEHGEPYSVQRTLALRCGQVQRIFVRVPPQASSCTVTLKSLDTSCSHRFVIHTVQCVNHCSSKSNEFFKMVSLAPGTSHQEAFKVAGGYILEVAVSKYWTSAGVAQAVLTVSLDGLQPQQSTIYMSAAEIGRVDVGNALRTVSDICGPSVVLRAHVCSYRPTSSKIVPMRDERDLLPQGRTIYGQTLTYTFSVAKTSEITVLFQYLSDMLYESEFDSQMWMLFDASKQFISAGDAYPSKYTVKVDKGEYTVLLRVRHERKDLLDKLSDLSLQVSFKLVTELKLDTYYKYNEALIGSRRAGPAQLRRGSALTLYVAPLSLSSNNSRASKVVVTSGQQLVGHLSLINTRAVNEKTGHFPFHYIISDVGRKSPSAAAKTAEKEPQSKLEEYRAALRDLQLCWMAKLPPGDDETVSPLLTELESGGRINRVTALAARILAYDVLKEDDAAAILQLADQIIDTADRTALLAFFGRKNSNNDEVKLKTEMDRERSALLEALCRKGVVLYECLQRKRPVDLLVTATQANIQELMTSALELAEPTDSKLVQLSVKHALLHGRLGLAVRYQTRANDDRPSKENELRLVEIYERLGWHYLCTHLKRSRAVRFPTSYRCF